MENSKLIDLLRSFSARERRVFLEMTASPFFNRNGDALRLAEWLDGLAPSYAGARRADAHATLYPGEPADEARLNHLMSFLLKLAEDFIAWDAFNKDPQAGNYYTLKALNERGLEKHYKFQLEKTRKHLQKPGQFFYERYAVEILEAARFARNSPRQFNESVQQATDQLDAFYLLEKLRRSCYMFTSQAILATPYRLQLVEEVVRFTGAQLHTMPSPAIEAYYRIFQLLTNDDPHDDFQALKRLLDSRGTEFAGQDLVDVYQYAINFCIIQIQKVRENYVQEAFDLYEKGMESGILLEGGQLSPWHFKNIITLALRLKHYDRTEQFIHEYTPLLPTDFQADARHYNLALLFYRLQQSDRALYHLNQVEFTDIHYSLGAKVMLCQIYYQNGDFDSLESLLHAFHTFLRRNRLIAENTRQAYLNFIQALRKIQRAQPRQFPVILQEVEQMPLLVAKDWLVSVLGGL